MQLEFKVDEQTLTWVNREKTPVADSVKYLTAKFTFSEEWTNIEKTATFFTSDGKPYNQLLVDDWCEVPHEVIKAPLFKVSVAGGDLITTNIIIVGIIKSGYVKGETPKPPTPDVYAQVLEKMTHTEEIAENMNEAEKVRVSAESERVEAEQIRTDNEKQRVEAEAKRQEETQETLIKVDTLVEDVEKAEELRNEAEAKRQTDTQEALVKIDKGFIDATMAADRASQAAELAEAQAIEANIAASEARESIPKKGVDYWTEEDKAEIVEDTLLELDSTIVDAKTATQNANEAADRANGVANTINNTFANALKGKVKGEAIAVSDVSPIEHDMKVNVSSKNLFNLSNVFRAANLTYTVEDNKLNIEKTNTNASNIYFDLGNSCKDYSNKTLTLSLTNETDKSINAYLYYYKNGDTPTLLVNFGGIKANTTTVSSVTVPENIIEENLLFRLYASIQGSYTFSNIQIEENTTATDYTPYVDIAQTKVKVYGRNILDADKGLNTNFVKNDDGTYTLSKLGTNSRFSDRIPFKFPNTNFSMYAEIVDTNMDGVTGVRVVVRNADRKETNYAGMSKNGTVYEVTSENPDHFQFYIDSQYADGSYITFKNPQVAVSNTPVTEYEQYKEPMEYTPSADGTVEGVASLYPHTTILSDTQGVLIETEYNRDINRAIEDIQNAIISLTEVM